MRLFMGWTKLWISFLLILLLIGLTAESIIEAKEESNIKLQDMANLDFQKVGKTVGALAGNKSAWPRFHITPELTKRQESTLKVLATGYTAGYESTGKGPSHPQYGITYSGVKVRRDKDAISTIAADLKVFPLGTILYIPGYGYGVVADKGSAIKGNKIDLYFSTTKQVYKEWGKKEVEVRIVKRGRGKLTETMLKELGKAVEVNKEVQGRSWEKSI